MGMLAHYTIVEQLQKSPQGGVVVKPTTTTPETKVEDKKPKQRGTRNGR